MAAIVPGMVASVAGMWALALAVGPASLWFAGVLAGIGLGAAHTGLLALTIDRVADHERGRGTAVFQLAWDFSGSIGSFLLGVVASGLDVASVFWLCGVVVLAGMVALFAGRSAGLTAARAQT